MKYLAIDQYGQTVRIQQHPRKELLEQLGYSHADNMYRDTAGGVQHVGYVIGGHWCTVYRVAPFKERAS